MPDSDYKGRAELHMDCFGKRIKENITKHFHKREDKNTFLRVNILLFLSS